MAAINVAVSATASSSPRVTGAPTVTVTRGGWGRVVMMGTLDDRGQTRSVPHSPMGTTGAPVSAASRAVPVWPRSTGSKNASPAGNGPLGQHDDHLAGPQGRGGLAHRLGRAGTALDGDAAERHGPGAPPPGRRTPPVWPGTAPGGPAGRPPARWRPRRSSSGGWRPAAPGRGRGCARHPRCRSGRRGRPRAGRTGAPGGRARSRPARGCPAAGPSARGASVGPGPRATSRGSAFERVGMADGQQQGQVEDAVGVDVRRPEVDGVVGGPLAHGGPLAESPDEAAVETAGVAAVAARRTGWR